MDSPRSSMRWALCTTRSSEADFGLGITSELSVIAGKYSEPRIGDFGIVALPMF